MNKLFQQIAVQFREYYKGLTPTKRLSIIGALAAGVIGIGVVTAMATGSAHVPLLTNVSTEQLPQVAEQLQKRGIPFKISDDGHTILVAKELLHSTQMAIMTEMGNNKVGQLGLEIFDKQDFGTTSYAQRINYQRALQGELMRSINTLSAVKQSKVILAMPPKKTFLEEGGQPTASVVLELHPGKILSPEQVRGVTFLVASAVEGLEPEKVTVVDSRGKVLSKQFTGEGAMTSEILDMKHKQEQEIAERIESIVSKVVGSGKVIARVDATLNPKSTISTEEEVNPDATALKSSQTEEEVLDGARTNPTGIPGARSNIPGSEDQGTVGFKQNVNKSLKVSNYEVPKTVRSVKEAAGMLERLSVAVLVDGVVKPVKDKDGNIREEWAPRSPEEMKKLEQIVRNSIGFNAQRGDSVTIENIAFQNEDFTEAEALLTSLERKKLVQSLLKWLLLGLSFGVFFFAVVRPFMRWITDSFQDTVDDMLPRTIEELEELQAVDNSLPGMTGALPALEESLDPNKAESELLKERIMSLMDTDSEKSASAFGLWLARRE